MTKNSDRKDDLKFERGKPSKVRAHSDMVNALAYSECGTKFASGSRNGKIEIWDSQDLKPTIEEIGVLGVQMEFISGLAFSPDGKELLSSSYDGTVVKYSAITGEVLSAPLVGNALNRKMSVRDVAFFRDAEKFLCLQDHTISIYDSKTFNRLKNIDDQDMDINTVKFSQLGDQFMVGGDENVIIRYNSNTLERIGNPIETGMEVILALDYSPDKRNIICGDGDGNVARFDNRTGDLISMHSKAHKDSVFKLVHSPDGNEIVSISLDNTIKRWNKDFSELLSKDSLNKAPTSLIYSPDGTNFIVGLENGDIMRCKGNRHEHNKYIEKSSIERYKGFDI